MTTMTTTAPSAATIARMGNPIPEFLRVVFADEQPGIEIARTDRGRANAGCAERNVDRHEGAHIHGAMRHGVIRTAAVNRQAFAARGGVH